MPAFTFRETPTLPFLAWCAEMKENSAEVTVHHGPWVETGANFYVEGAWSGAFERRSFPTALTFTGTGGIVQDSTVIFSSPSNTLQPIYLVRRNRSLVCSNSLAFLLVISKDEVDPDYRFYEADMMSIMFGLAKYKKKIPTRKKNFVHMYYHCNLFVSPDLQVRQQPRNSLATFVGYEDYYEFLQNEVSRVTTNASDAHRNVAYKPLTTISSGYDSPASSVLARMAGCKEALTYTLARANFEQRDDSGAQIAQILGLDVCELDPEDYLRQDRYLEAEFIARGTGADEVYIGSAENLLQRTILCTGNGAKLWERINLEVGPHMVRRDASGSSLDEFRFRVGFLHFPIPYIGFTGHPSIHRILNSQDMAPWSLQGTMYDKPIPRRIAEEAGVPRTLFGQCKKAVGRPCIMTTGRQGPALQKVLSPATFEDFRAFIRGKPIYRNRFEKLLYNLMHAFYHWNNGIIKSRKVSRLASKLNIKMPEKPWIPWKYHQKRTEHSMLFHWSHEKLKSRYAIDGSSKQGAGMIPKI
jgi:hypothetical protein